MKKILLLLICLSSRLMAMNSDIPSNISTSSSKRKHSSIECTENTFKSQKIIKNPEGDRIIKICEKVELNQNFDRSKIFDDCPLEEEDIKYAINYLTKKLETTEYEGLPRAQTFYALAFFQSKQNDVVATIASYKHALLIQEFQGLRRAQVYRDLGVLEGNSNEAISYFRSALAIPEYLGEFRIATSNLLALLFVKLHSRQD